MACHVAGAQVGFAPPTLPDRSLLLPLRQGDLPLGLGCGRLSASPLLAEGFVSCEMPLNGEELSIIFTFIFNIQ